MLLISSRKMVAAVRRLESAGLVVHGAGEGALDVAEQLAFQKAFAEGAAVDADVGTILTRAEAMDVARDDFLAGSVSPISRTLARELATRRVRR